MPDHNLIVVRSGLRAVIERSALAHEIGHAELGHFDDSPKHEKAADRYAADRLISPAELRAASRWAPNHAVLASELGVTQRLLDAYLDLQASR
ncbi:MULTISPECIES: ImmA/IrrE family metallo-endopeptidase [Mycetocola]|uniref:ImmA/IrrE family metallo-endopeptidase n=1 Tax=Mycetocola TaxID=76634 RepID=UPI0037C5816B